MADKIVVPVQPGYSEVFESANGTTGRTLTYRANRVALAAKAQAGVQTGALKRDIGTTWTRRSGSMLTIRVGSSIKHALVHHEGSRPHVIRPKRAKALRFVNKAGDVVFAGAVQHPGTRANHYLTENLHLAVE